MDTIVASDIHLGNPESNAGSLLAMLEATQYGELIVLGDLHEDGGVIDEDQFRFIMYLRRNKDRVVYVDGNHDAPNVVSRMIGVPVHARYERIIGGKRFCFVHGHRYDRLCFLFDSHLTDKMFNYVTWLLRYVRFKRFDLAQWMDDFHYRFAERIALKAVKDAFKRGYDTMVCGHVHVPKHCFFREEGHGKRLKFVQFSEKPAEGKTVEYINCGGWIGKLQTHLVINDQGVSTLYV